MTDDFTLKITVALVIVISTLEIHFLFFKMNFVKVLIPVLCGGYLLYRQQKTMSATGLGLSLQGWDQVYEFFQ
jgi:hypothetical protein